MTFTKAGVTQNYISFSMKLISYDESKSTDSVGLDMSLGDLLKLPLIKSLRMFL